MPSKTFIVNFCDRCDEEVDRFEAVPGTASKRTPAFYRQKSVDTQAGTEIEEKTLDTLCKKCKKEVESLDNRIFSGGKKEPKEGAPDVPQQ